MKNDVSMAARRDFMTRVALGAAFPSTLVAQPAPQSPLVPRAIAGQGYRLVKNWDFATTVTTSDQLHQEFFTRYIYEDGHLDHLNDEWTRYRDQQNHVFADGRFFLVAHPVAGMKPGGIESGMLRSRWSGKYGYIEGRMRVPTGRGMWPAFWINPEDRQWPPEIDIVEIVTNDRDDTKRSFHFLHGKGAVGSDAAPLRLDANQSRRSEVDFAKGLHTFAVHWTEGSVQHFVDDELIADRRYRWLHDDGSDGGAAHVLVNLAVGGRWPGPPTSDQDFPAAFELAYIRVWQPA